MTETDTSTKTTATAAESEPAWFAEARDLHSQGVEDTAIAKAVHKRVNDVRKLIRRDAEAAEAAAAAGGTEPAPEPTNPPAEPADPPIVNPVEPTAPADPDGAPVQAGGGTTVTAEQAARQRELAGDSGGDAAPEELFPVGSIEGDGFSHKSIGNAKEPVTEITVAMTGGEVPMPKGTGLLDPHKEGMLLVTYECTDGGRPIPIREGERGDKKIVGWKTRQQVRPIYIERVKGEEGVILGHFAALLEASPSRAGAILDQLLVRAGRKLES